MGATWTRWVIISIYVWSSTICSWDYRVVLRTICVIDYGSSLDVCVWMVFCIPKIKLRATLSAYRLRISSYHGCLPTHQRPKRRRSKFQMPWLKWKANRETRIPLEVVTEEQEWERHSAYLVSRLFDSVNFSSKMPKRTYSVLSKYPPCCHPPFDLDLDLAIPLHKATPLMKRWDWSR